MKRFSLRVSLALVSFLAGIGLTYVATQNAWVSDMANQPSVKPQEMPFAPPSGAVPVGPARIQLAAHQEKAPGAEKREPVAPSGGHHGGASPAGADHHGAASPADHHGGAAPSGQDHHGAASPSGQDHHGGAAPSGEDHHGGATPEGADHHGGTSPGPAGHHGGAAPSGEDHHGGASPAGPDHHGGTSPESGDHHGGTSPASDDHHGGASPAEPGHHGGTAPAPDDHHGGTSPADPGHHGAASPAPQDHHGGTSPSPQGHDGGHGDAHGMAMDQPGIENPVEPTVASVKEGESLFRIYCSVCHGAKGQGGMPIASKYPTIPKFTRSLLQQTPDSHMFGMLTSGHGPMPGYAEALSSSERWEVINYVRRLQNEL